MDDALRNDLSLATMATPYQPQQYVSPQEMGYAYGQQGYYPQPQGYYGQPQPYYPQPQRVVYQPAPQPRVIRRAPTSSGTVYRSEPTIVRNTKRDAVIGGVAGAAIGAVTTRNRVKGAVLGGAAGAVLGGIIGHQVDVKRLP